MGELLKNNIPVGTPVTYRDVVHVASDGTWKAVEREGVVTTGYCKPGYTSVREHIWIRSGDSFKFVEKPYPSCFPTNQLRPSSMFKK